MAATRAELLDYLKNLGIQVTTLDHEPVFTVSESSALERDVPGAHTKNLFLKDKKGRLFLIVALNDADINLKQAHQVIGAQGRLSFGSGEQLAEKLGVKPGSVTPFALINDRDEHNVTPVLDAAMMQNDILNFHPLKNDATTTISAKDLEKFIASCGYEVKILAVSEQAKKLTSV